MVAARLAQLIGAAAIARSAGAGEAILHVHDAPDDLIDAAAAIEGAERRQASADGFAWEVVVVNDGLKLFGVQRRCLAHGEICKTDGCEASP